MRIFLGFLVGISLIVLVFVLILKSFSGNGGKPSMVTPLLNYANTSTVMRYSVDGPVVANQEYESLTITVSQTQSQIQIMRGYENQVISSKSYPSNEPAYATFLRALDLAGYTKGTGNSSLSDDRGYCPTGSRYLYEINNGSRDLQRSWSTSCGGQGTFEGNVQIVQTLFQDQIPDYSSLTSQINFGSSALL